MKHTSKLIIRQEHCDPQVEINVGNEVYAVTFSANGEYLLSGGQGRVQVWQVKDGTQVATMDPAECVLCLAVSNDGRWIAAGTLLGDVLVWDAETYEQVFTHGEDSRDILGVDFSPDSTRLVSASDNCTASIWDVPTRKRVHTLDHKHGPVCGAKYSPHGDRIATASFNSIRVWDSRNGRLLGDINVGVTPLYNSGLLWSNNNLFAISGSKIKQLNASTELVVSEWSVPDSGYRSCIALSKHGEFITYSANHTVTFWDTSSHTQLGHIQLHPQDICSTALSPGDGLIAIGEERGVIVRRISRIIVSFLSL